MATAASSRHLQCVDVRQALANSDVLIHGPHLTASSDVPHGHGNQGLGELAEPEHAQQPDDPSGPGGYYCGCLKPYASVRARSPELLTAP